MPPIAIRRIEPPSTFTSRLKVQYGSYLTKASQTLYIHHLKANQQQKKALVCQKSTPNNAQHPTRIVCISDTHNTQPVLPPGDILLHAGDLTERGTFAELQAQLDWLNTQPHRHKVVIGGNHDAVLDEAFLDLNPWRRGEGAAGKENLRWGSVIYLQDEEVTIQTDEGRKLKIYGSPYTPQFGNWAFQVPPIRDIWSHKVPRDVDILLTHGPPKWHLDHNQAGCEFLNEELCRIRPKLVGFGHIHAGHGLERVVFDEVKRLFDSARNGKSGIWGLLCMMALVMYADVLRHCGRGGGKAEETILVNAAVVGGYNNQERREPIVVDI